MLQVNDVGVDVDVDVVGVAADVWMEPLFGLMSTEDDDEDDATILLAVAVTGSGSDRACDFQEEEAEGN